MGLQVGCKGPIIARQNQNLRSYSRLAMDSGRRRRKEPRDLKIASKLSDEEKVSFLTHRGYIYSEKGFDPTRDKGIVWQQGQYILT